MNTQQRLKNDIVSLVPLKEEDFEQLYAIASDPLIWEQHPNKDRYQREVFQTFFEGALASKGAYLIYENTNNELVGCTRFYDLDQNAVFIGYTFIKRSHWGAKINPSVKALMLDYAFQFVNEVKFHIGAQNIRSQKAIERLGAKKVREIEVEYYGEVPKLNFEYVIFSQMNADLTRR